MPTAKSEGKGMNCSIDSSSLEKLYKGACYSNSSVSLAIKDYIVFIYQDPMMTMHKLNIHVCKCMKSLYQMQQVETHDEQRMTQFIMIVLIIV